jgi:hypothetical protein
LLEEKKRKKKTSKQEQKKKKKKKEEKRKKKTQHRESASDHALTVQCATVPLCACVQTEYDASVGPLEKSEWAWFQLSGWYHPSTLKPTRSGSQSSSSAYIM